MSLLLTIASIFSHYTDKFRVWLWLGGPLLMTLLHAILPFGHVWYAKRIEEQSQFVINSFIYTMFVGGWGLSVMYPGLSRLGISSDGRVFSHVFWIVLAQLPVTYYPAQEAYAIRERLVKAWIKDETHFDR